MGRCMQRLKVFTWHIHGSYLYYLSGIPHDIYLPVKKGGDTKSNGYFGRTPNYDWPASVHEVPISEIRKMQFDCILYQASDNYTRDQYDILTPEQRRLPKIFLEHDPPRLHPTDTRHIVDDPDVLVVHVTHFNNLMWHCGKSKTKVIEHGVPEREEPLYRGDIGK